MYVIAFAEPMWANNNDDSPFVNALKLIRPADAVAFQRKVHPEIQPYSYEEALNDFLIVHHGLYIDLDHTRLDQFFNVDNYTAPAPVGVSDPETTD